MGGRRARARFTAIVAALLALVALGLGLRWRVSRGSAASLPGVSAARVEPVLARNAARARAPSPRPSAILPPASPDRRLARAEQTLASYLESSRYPPWSRPIAERPDLVEPHAVPVRRLPLSGRATSRARVVLRQDRLHLTAGEAASLRIGCERDDAPVRCEVLSASAAPAPDMTPSAGPSPVRFEATGDREVAARFAPGEQGFGAFHGPLRVDVSLRVAGEEGSASFNLDYTPSPPARFTGAVRESLVDGAIELGVGLRVERPGRYLVRARVEDAGGRRFAFLTADAAFEAGERIVRLRLFGKVALDADARAPFRLRDLEGFRLAEDAFPDREVLPALDGVVYTTRAYAAGELSPDAWESEAKSRRVELLARGVDEARLRQK